MNQNTHHVDLAPAGRLNARRVTTILLIVAGAGLIAALAHALFAEHGYRRFMLAWLVAFSFWLSITLGAMFLVVIHHLARAGWWVLLRRPAEVLGANVPVLALLFLPIAASAVIGGGEVFPWARSAVVAERHEGPEARTHEGDAETALRAYTPDAFVPSLYAHQQLDDFTLKKRAYLNVPFFLARWVVMLGLWGLLGWLFWRWSVRQDHGGDIGDTLRCEHLAGPAALLLGVTLIIAATDLLMSLNPHWYSTIMGVYYFSGAAVGALAVLTLAVLLLQRHQLLPSAIGHEHYLDLGRLLFGFLFFWAYIAFSQYMLLWYANIPEMQAWLHIRGAAQNAPNAWSWVLLVLLFGHFLIPFVGLMSRHAKLNPAVLGFWAVWLLVMHYVDVLWLVMPELGPRVSFGLIEIGLVLATGGLYLAAAIRRAAGHSLVPLADPRMSESVAHEPAY